MQICNGPSGLSEMVIPSVSVPAELTFLKNKSGAAQINTFIFFLSLETV